MTRARRSTPTKSARNRNSLNWLGIGLGLGAIALLCGGGYWLYRRITAAPVGLVAIAESIPQSAQLVVAFNGEADSWQKLSQMSKPGLQKSLGQAMQRSPLNALLAQSKTDFAQDVQPWLGSEAIVALVGDPQNPDNPPATLVILPSLDGRKADAFLGKYREALAVQGAQFSEKNYKGYRYFESPTKELKQSLITANLDGKLVVLANSSNLIQQVFDTYKGEQPSLAKKASFSKGFSRADNPQFSETLVQIYLDGAIALGFVGNQPDIEVITLIAGRQKQGLRLQLDTYFKPGANISAPASSDLLSRLPQDTFFLISGSNLQQSWQTLQARAKTNPASDRLLSQWRADFKRQLGLDLEADVLKWMTGDYAIAAIADNTGVLKNPGFGLAILSQTSDVKATTKLLERWSTLAKQGSIPLVPQGLELKNKSVEGKDLTLWEVNSRSTTTRLASQGFLEPNLAFWAMGDLAKNLLPAPTAKLSDSNIFQALTTGLPKPNSGYFYLNMAAAMAITNQVIPSEVKTNSTYIQIRETLESIQGISATTSTLDPQTVRLDLLFSLNPATDS